MRVGPQAQLVEHALFVVRLCRPAVERVPGIGPGEAGIRHGGGAGSAAMNAASRSRSARASLRFWSTLPLGSQHRSRAARVGSARPIQQHGARSARDSGMRARRRAAVRASVAVRMRSACACSRVARTLTSASVTGGEAHLGRPVQHGDLVVGLQLAVAIGLEDPPDADHAERVQLGCAQGTHAGAPRRHARPAPAPTGSPCARRAARARTRRRSGAIARGAPRTCPQHVADRRRRQHRAVQPGAGSRPPGCVGPANTTTLIAPPCRQRPRPGHVARIVGAGLPARAPPRAPPAARSPAGPDRPRSPRSSRQPAKRSSSASTDGLTAGARRWIAGRASSARSSGSTQRSFSCVPRGGELLRRQIVAGAGDVARADLHRLQQRLQDRQRRGWMAGAAQAGMAVRIPAIGQHSQESREGPDRW